MQET
ncbi:Protein of unknown function [Bacillus cytotoxicus]|jgi:hypothetical protein